MYAQKKKKSASEVLSPVMTSYVGCCHGDEWHLSAWGQHRVLHRPLSCCYHSRARGSVASLPLREQKALCGVGSADGLQQSLTDSLEPWEMASAQKHQCLNKSCKNGCARSLSSVSNLPRSKFRMEILSSCQFLVKWVIASGHLGLNHIETDLVWPLWKCLPFASVFLLLSLSTTVKKNLQKNGNFIC